MFCPLLRVLLSSFLKVTFSSTCFIFSLDQLRTETIFCSVSSGESNPGQQNEQAYLTSLSVNPYFHIFINVIKLLKMVKLCFPILKFCKNTYLLYVTISSIFFSFLFFIFIIFSEIRKNICETEIQEEPIYK